MPYWESNKSSARDFFFAATTVGESNEMEADRQTRKERKKRKLWLFFELWNDLKAF